LGASLHGNGLFFGAISMSFLEKPWKPLTQDEYEAALEYEKNINDLGPYERGEYDAVHGHFVREDQEQEYYWGYADQYASEQCDTAKTELTVGGQNELI